MFQSPLTVTLPSPEPLTAAMFLFLLNMKEPGKGPVNPKLLFNQLCQKYDAFLHSVFHEIIHAFSLNGLSLSLACCATVVLVLHLFFTCFQAVLLWWPLSPARHRQHLVPAEWKFNVHETQPKGMNHNEWLIFFSAACCSCATCAIFDLDQGLTGWTIVVFAFLYECLVGWVLFAAAMLGSTMCVSVGGIFSCLAVQVGDQGIWCRMTGLVSGAALTVILVLRFHLIDKCAGVCVHVARHLTWYHLIL